MLLVYSSIHMYRLHAWYYWAVDAVSAINQAEFIQAAFGSPNSRFAKQQTIGAGEHIVSYDTETSYLQKYLVYMYYTIRRTASMYITDTNTWHSILLCIVCHPNEVDPSRHTTFCEKENRTAPKALTSTNNVARSDYFPPHTRLASVPLLLLLW